MAGGEDEAVAIRPGGLARMCLRKRVHSTYAIESRWPACTAGGWPIRVTDDHRSDATAEGQTIALTGGGLATSSTTVRRWRSGDAEVHHIVDPRSGAPAAEVWRTVSVAARTCVEANSASTAAIVRGEAAVAWLEQAGLPARLVRRDGTTVTTCGWPLEAAA